MLDTDVIIVGAGPTGLMLADAEAALAGLPKASNWRPSALVAQGAALLLLGRDEEADDVLAQPQPAPPSTARPRRT